MKNTLIILTFLFLSIISYAQDINLLVGKYQYSSGSEELKLEIKKTFFEEIEKHTLIGNTYFKKNDQVLINQDNKISSKMFLKDVRYFNNDVMYMYYEETRRFLLYFYKSRQVMLFHRTDKGDYVLELDKIITEERIKNSKEFGEIIPEYQLPERIVLTKVK